jgi:hypothetical protein
MGRRGLVSVKGHFRGGSWVNSYARSFPSTKIITTSTGLGCQNILILPIKIALWLLLASLWASFGLLVLSVIITLFLLSLIASIVISILQKE